MKINKKQKTHFLALIILPIVLIVAVCGYFYWNSRHSQPSTNTSPSSDSQKIDYSPPTDEQKKAGSYQKELTNQKDTQPTTIRVSITAANLVNDLVQIRSIISGTVSNSGSCTITLTNGSATVTKTASTYALPSSSTCQGFDINRSELSSGKWQISLTVTIGAETVSASSEITLE